MLRDLGDLARRDGDHRRAADFYKEALAIFHKLGHRRGMVRCWSIWPPAPMTMGVRIARLYSRAQRRRCAKPWESRSPRRSRKNSMNPSRRLREIAKVRTDESLGRGTLDDRGSGFAVCVERLRSAARLKLFRIQKAPHRGNPVGRQPRSPRVLADLLFILREVHAIDFLVRDVAMQPLNTGAESFNTAKDRRETSRISSSVRFPAPGTSRSITYSGMQPSHDREYHYPHLGCSSGLMPRVNFASNSWVRKLFAG